MSALPPACIEKHTILARWGNYIFSSMLSFQKLVAAVGLGRAGIVMGLEVSRLARNCADWHRLIEICGIAATLILDEDGIYDPANFNDRLLLGLKGTMSEAETHLLKARLSGGILNKARRGELRTLLPVVALIDHLSDQHTYQQIAEVLNQREIPTGAGDPFGKESVRWVCHSHGIKSYKERLKSNGMMTPAEVSARYCIPVSSVKYWRNKGVIRGAKCNDKGDWLYYPVDQNDDTLPESFKQVIISQTERST